MRYIILFIYFMFALPGYGLAVSLPVNGADRIDEFLPLIKGKRVSLVVNQTSMSGNVHLLDRLYEKGIHPIQVFAPEHGFRGEADAGETVVNGKDMRTGTPIISLYGKHKKPQAGQLNRTDVVIFDIQDVGVRFYTYISTLYYIMQACAECDKEVIVLDRPNPCDYIDGPVLRPRYKSFVGMFPVPLLHGCTVGELAQMINGEGWLGKNLRCKLTVVKVKGWKHGQTYSLPIKPSPNLPDDQSIALYPSLCPFEGTSVSVGRGTVTPFQQIGTPLLHSLEGNYCFTPQPLKGFDKNPLHKGKPCYGWNLQNVKVKGFTLKYVIDFYQAYKDEGKEALFFTRPQWFDLLMGTDQIRLGIQAGKTEEQLRSEWQMEQGRYKKMRQKYLLYDE